MADDSELESSLAALSVADDVLRSPPPPLVVRTPSEVEEAAVAGRRRSASGRDDFDFQTPSAAADLPYRPSPTGSSAATSARVGSGSRGSARWQSSSRKPLSAHTGEPRSGGGSCTCAICLSPVRRVAAPTRRGLSFAGDGPGSLPRKLPFRTQCCGQLFHRSCLSAFKEQAGGNATLCPLCRSDCVTGLTPRRQPAPRTSFVGASSMRELMRSRAAAARLAVQRGLSARAAAEEHLAQVAGRQGHAEVLGQGEAAPSSRRSPPPPRPSPSPEELSAAYEEALVSGPWVPARVPASRQPGAARHRPQSHVLAAGAPAPRPSSDAAAASLRPSGAGLSFRRDVGAVPAAGQEGAQAGGETATPPGHHARASQAPPVAASLRWRAAREERAAEAALAARQRQGGP